MKLTVLGPPAPLQLDALGEHDRAELIAALPELYALGDLTTFPRVSLQVINRLLPACFSTYNEMSAATQTARCVYEPADQQELAEGLKPLLWEAREYHPLLQRHLHQLTEGVVKLSDYLSEEEFRQSPFYEQVMVPLGVADTMSFVLRAAGGLQVFFAINSGQRFTERDRALAGLLQPHLVQSFANAVVFTDARALALLSSHAFAEAKSHGLMLVEPNGRIVHANAPAAEHLAAAFQHTKVEVLPPSLCDWLQRHRPGLAQPLCPLEVHGGPRQFSFRAAAAGEEHWFIASHENDALALARTLEQAYGLTGRQADILLRLADGKTNAEIGTLLEISERTVAKHLEHLFDRLGVDNRKSAMRKAMDVVGMR